MPIGVPIDMANIRGTDDPLAHDAEVLINRMHEMDDVVKNQPMGPVLYDNPIIVFAIRRYHKRVSYHEELILIPTGL